MTRARMPPGSSMTLVVRARPQRVARRTGAAPSRSVRAVSEARYVAQPVCAGVRHSRACFSGESDAGGVNAAQRWSRVGMSRRQPPVSATRKGQPRGLTCSAFASAADGLGRSSARASTAVVDGRGSPAGRGLSAAAVVID
jgi:hypothetical protein